MSESSTRHDGGGEAGCVLTADAIAIASGGRVIGDATATVSGIAPLDRAGPHDLSFLATAKYTVQFAASRAGIVLVSPALAELPGAARARVLVDNPHDALLALVPRFHPTVAPAAGLHPTATIARGARPGRGVRLGPYVVIGENAVIGDGVVLDAHVVVGNGVAIGAGSHLYPGVVAYTGTHLGCRVTLHAGVRAGSDGFGYVFREGRHEKIPHIGRCIIEDDVEIGANTAVDRGSIDDTVIGAGTKIDNLVQIGHNVRIGRGCVIVAQAGIAGSTHIEDGAVIGGQVGIAGHVVIGAGARIGAQGGVFGDVPAGATWSGYPARPHTEALRAQAALFKLPKLLRRLERLLSDDA